MMPKKNKNMSQIIIPSTSTEFNIKDLVEEDETFDIETSFEKHIANDSQIDKDFSNFNKKKSSVSPNESFLESKGPKHKTVINNINSTVSSFLENYNNIILDDIMKKFNDEILEIQEEKFNKKFDIYKSFHSIITENEMMMKDDDSHKDSLKAIVSSLEEERDSDLQKIEEEFEKQIELKKQALKENGLVKNKSLQLKSEKFKMEMLSILNEIIKK